MKVLQLCNKPPLPALDGGCIAMNNVTQGLLNSGVSVKVLSIATDKHPFQEEKMESDYIEKTGFEAIYVDTRLNIVDAFSSLVTSDSYNINRFFSPDFDAKLRDILSNEQFDVVHLESLFMTPYIATIRKFSEAKIVLRSHNLEHIIWERLASSSKNKAKKIYLNYLSKKLKSYEHNVLNEIDGLATISKDDTNRYKKINPNLPKVTIPFGIDLKDYHLQKAVKDELFHIGAMNWNPNIDGIIWFLEEVWPGILKEVPELKIHLAGRETPDWLFKMGNKSLKVHGEVESAALFMKDFSMMLVPLLSAGGMRVKIIEGMARGKCVITTTIGAEGIDFKAGKNIIIADTPTAFKKEIKTLLKSPEMIHEIGLNARKLVEKKYDNHNIISNLLDFYKSIS